jgi:hypothetical protein
LHARQSIVLSASRVFNNKYGRVCDQKEGIDVKGIDSGIAPAGIRDLSGWGRKQIKNTISAIWEIILPTRLDGVPNA